MPTDLKINAEINVVRGKPFEAGNKLAPGGEREGSGRKPDELKAKIQEIGDPVKVVQYFYDLAIGATGEGIDYSKVDHKQRIRAGELYLDRRMGKVPQEFDVTQHDSERPSTDALIQTMSALRSELDALRKGTGVEAGK